MTLTTAVVLLRGVNVGGHPRVPSADLRAIGRALGAEGTARSWTTVLRLRDLAAA